MMKAVTLVEEKIKWFIAAAHLVITGSQFDKYHADSLH